MTEKVVVFPSPSKASLQSLIDGLADRRLDVLWTSNFDQDIARVMAFILVENYRDVAGVVVDWRNRWPFEEALFIHVMDKEFVVEEVVQARGFRHGGRIV